LLPPRIRRETAGAYLRAIRASSLSAVTNLPACTARNLRAIVLRHSGVECRIRTTCECTSRKSRSFRREISRLISRTVIGRRMPVQTSASTAAPLAQINGAICPLAAEATAAAKGLAALPIVTFEKGRARTPLRAGAGPPTGRCVQINVKSAVTRTFPVGGLDSGPAPKPHRQECLCHHAGFLSSDFPFNYTHVSWRAALQSEVCSFIAKLFRPQAMG